MVLKDPEWKLVRVFSKAPGFGPDKEVLECIDHVKPSEGMTAAKLRIIRDRLNGGYKTEEIRLEFFELGG